MALKKTQLLDITSVTGIATVGILTVGVTPTAGGVGVASTSYIKNVIMHNTGLGTCRFRYSSIQIRQMLMHLDMVLRQIDFED